MINYNDIIGCFTYSLAGHDKGDAYIIVDVEDDYAYLVNGINRTVDKPKRKKLKHLQINKKKDERILEQMHISESVDKKGLFNDEIIRKALSDHESGRKEDKCQNQIQ